MVAQTDRRAIWHPRHPDKFAVGGGANISLYEWSKEEGNIRRAASYDDLQHMKASTVLHLPSTLRSSDVTASFLTVLCVELRRVIRRPVRCGFLKWEGRSYSDVGVRPTGGPERNPRSCAARLFGRKIPAVMQLHNLFSNKSGSPRMRYG
jgi:hypothetical protein